MKCILCFPFKDQETGRAIHEALEFHGVQTLPVDANESFELLYTVVQECKDMDFILCSRTPELYPQLVRIKRDYPKVKLAVWNVDVRESYATWGSLAHMFEFVDFHFDVSCNYFKDAIFMPQGLDDRFYHPVTPTYKRMTEWTCDVGFIGNVHPRFHPERQVTLNMLSENFNFRHFNGAYKSDHNMAVACSKINLCLSAFGDVENSYSVRNWKVLGADGVAIDRWHPGIEEFFKGYVESFKSNEELFDKVKHMLANYDYYKMRAQEAGKWIRATQTYKHRIKEILNHVYA